MNLNRDKWKKVIAVDMLLVCFALNVSVIGQMLGAIEDTYAITFGECIKKGTC